MVQTASKSYPTRGTKRPYRWGNQIVKDYTSTLVKVILKRLREDGDIERIISQIPTLNDEPGDFGMLHNKNETYCLYRHDRYRW